MKKLFLLSLLACSSVFAQEGAYHIQKCTQDGPYVRCQIEKGAPQGAPQMNQYPNLGGGSNSNPVDPSKFGLPGGVNSPDGFGINPQGQQGSYSNVPGGNVFVFCSGPRPSKHSPWRSVYNRICKDSQNGPRPTNPDFNNLPQPPGTSDLPQPPKPPQPQQLQQQLR